MADKTRGRRKTALDEGFSFESYVPFMVNRLAIALLTYSTAEFEKRGLTVPKYRILMVLRQHRVLSFKQIAQMTRIEPPTLSRLLNTLEESGLIRRSRSVADTRSVMVSLSPAGRSAAEKVIPFSKAVEDMVMQGVSEADAATFRRLLGELYENVLGQGRGPGRRK